MVGFLGCGFVGTDAQLSALEPQLAQARAEHRRFKAFLQREAASEEPIRDSILAQIRRIRTVDGDRYVWPHILDEVSRALPPTPGWWTWPSSRRRRRRRRGRRRRTRKSRSRRRSQRRS